MDSPVFLITDHKKVRKGPVLHKALKPKVTMVQGVGSREGASQSEFP